MPSEEVPQLKAIRKQLKRLEKTSSAIKEQLAGLQQTIVEGASRVSESVTGQTKALGEIELLSLRGRLEAITELLSLEEERLESEKNEDLQALERLERKFDDAIERYSSVRNQRVREMIAPILDLLEDDHNRQLEPRTEELDDVLDDFLEVTIEEVEAREAILRGLMQELREKISELQRNRREARETIDRKIIPFRDLGLDEVDEPTCFAVPFQVVEVEQSDVGRRRRYVVVPPSTLEMSPAGEAPSSDGGAGGTSPFNFRLHPISGFERITREFQDRISSIADMVEESAQEAETHDLGDFYERSDSEDWRMRIAGPNFESRTVRVVTEVSPASSVGELVERHAPEDTHDG